MKKILSHGNYNLHSASAAGGLVFLPMKKVTRVPDDVVDHPGFKLLTDAGLIKDLDPKAPELTQAELDADAEENEEVVVKTTPLGSKVVVPVAVVK